MIVLESNQDKAAISDTETCPSLNACMGDGGGRVPMIVISIENHPNDSRITIRKDGTVQTLSGRMGTGGGNIPLVLIGRKGAEEFRGKGRCLIGMNKR